MFNKAILWNLSYGVYLVSSLDEGRPIGCIVNSAVQLTHDTIAVSLNHQNYTNQILKKNKDFAITILSTNIDPNIISLFGFSSSLDRNKFEGLDFQLINNLPVLMNTIGYITLNIIKEVELETHTLFIAKITGGDILNNDIPMTYKYYHEVIKGRAPEKAPTYIATDDIIESNNVMKSTRYKCKICGYIYEGDISLQDDSFVCPICKQAKEVFHAI